MKKFAALSLIQLFSICVLYAQPIVHVLKDDAASTIVEINFDMAELQATALPQSIHLKGCTPWQQKGAPDLPKYSFSLQIPNTANAVATVLAKTSFTFGDIDVLPSKGKLSRLQNPAEIIADKGDAYNTNSFYPAAICNTSDPYIQRDIRGQTWQIAPYQYNPITKQLVAYTYLKIEIKYSGTNTNNSLGSIILPTKINETFYEIYKNQFINFNCETRKQMRYAPILENDNLLIYCPNKYLTTIQPFVDWKKQKGIYTKVIDIDTMPGNDLQAEIFNNIKYRFTTDTTLSHVLMIGNDADIPVMEDGNVTIFSLGSDNPYGYMLGNDHRAEIIVGRFSGSNASQIAAQVTKSIAYEKTPWINNIPVDWYSKQVAIASNAPTKGDDTQFDYQHQREIADSNINAGPYKQKIELFDGNKGGADAPTDPQAADLVNAINNGVGLINYSGHGYYNRLVTSNFSTTEVDSLQNTNGAWPFLLVVGCSPGDFINTTECLAEKLSYTTDISNKPVGTIINAMSTVAQWWNEPMEAQDEFNAILRDARPFAVKHSFGGMLVNAFGSMMDKYNIDSGGNQMTDTWQIFGDPTLVVRTGLWGSINCSNFSVLPNMGTTFSMNCNANGADVCLYQNGEILATTKVVGNVASFTFAPVDTSKLIYLTGTKYNYAPLVGYIYSPTQIQNFALLNGTSIYPNPTTNNVQVQSIANIISVDVVNMQGAIVQSVVCNNAKQHKLNLATIASGVYYCKIVTEYGIVIKKLVKQ